MKVRDEWGKGERRGNWTGKREREKGSVRQVGVTVCFFFTEHTLPQKGKKKEKRGKEESVNRKSEGGRREEVKERCKSLPLTCDSFCMTCVAEV